MRHELVRAGGRGAEIGISAIDRAMVVYNAMRRLEDEWGQSKVHPAFTRPGAFTISPTSFVGGLGGIGFIPDECVIDYGVWHAPQDSAEGVKAEVEAQIAHAAATDSWLREHPPELEWTFWWPPYDVPQDAPICTAAAAAWEAVLGGPARFYGFAAVDDAAFLNRAGIPTISLGPGHVGLAHKANEYVEIREALQAAKIYALSVVEWCGV
jgi:acetylornithine deacetylase